MKRFEPSKKTSRSDWHSADIVAAIRKRGTSLRKLSIAHGYHPNVLAQALRDPYPKAEQCIAKCIGVRPYVIWPSRYDERGTPLRDRRAHGQGRWLRETRVQAKVQSGNGQRGAVD